MDAQAPLRGGTPINPKPNGAPEGVVGGIAEFGNDISTLAELQIKLAWLDLKECLSQALIPLVMIVAGFLLLVGALPVALLGIAQIVASYFEISPGAAMLLTGVAVLLLAAVILLVAVMRIGPSFTIFRRSSEEFNRNLNWIRTVLMYSGRNVQRRRF